MGYDNEVIRVCRLTNGWEVELYDPSPAVAKAEKKAASGIPVTEASLVGSSPWRTVMFTTFDEVVEYLEEKGPNLKPRNFDEEYAKSFADTVKKMGSESSEKK